MKERKFKRSRETQVKGREGDMTEVETQQQPVTIFHDAQDFNVIHPLTTSWTLWYTTPQTHMKEDWNDLLKSVIKFGTVEEFWGVYNNIQKVQDLPMKSDYHIFREDVRPEWEAKDNKLGGKWAYQFKDKKLPIDEIWLCTVRRTTHGD